MKFKNIQIYPLIFSLTLFIGIIFALLLGGLKQTSGHFVYPLDDTYIHLAMARHFTERGSWGVSLYGFSSSTSSPLWTLSISLFFKLFGINDSIPLILCLVIAIIAIIIMFILLEKDFAPMPLSALLISIIIFSPLPIVVLTGLEHTLHSLLNFILLFLIADSLNKTRINQCRYFLLLLLSSLLTITRYEGLFLIWAACMLFLIYKRLSSAISISVAGFLPILIYGIISLKNGWSFLPNPILLKGHIGSFFQNPLVLIMNRFSENLIKCPSLLLMILFILVFYILGNYQKCLTKKVTYLAFIFLASTILHLMFADTGWFYRYEAYLILTGLPVVYYLIRSFWPDKLENKKAFGTLILLTTSGLLILSSLAVRSINAYKKYSFAVRNIYEQQYQMGLFFRRYYEGSIIAANDIGAINYLADIYTLDLVGLANKEVLEARIKNKFNSDFLRTFVLSKNAEIIVIYKSWFYPYIPSYWIEIGRWRIRDNVVCASDEVSFFVAQPYYEEKAISALRAFKKQLPPKVRQAGKYLNQEK